MNKLTLFYLQNYKIFSTFTAIKSFCDPLRSFCRLKWQISLPFHILQLVKSLLLHILEEWKRERFRAEPPRIGHQREFSPPPLPPPSSPIHCVIGFFLPNTCLFGFWFLTRLISIVTKVLLCIYICTKLEYIHIFNPETQSRMKQIKSNTTIKRFAHHWVKRVKFAVIFNERGVPHILFYSIGL